MSQRVLEILLGVKGRKMRRDLRGIEGDVGSFAKRTTHKLRSSFKDAFGALAGVGTVAGIAAIGKGVLDVDKKLTRLGIQAGQTKAEMIGFHNRLRDLSDDTGLSTEHLADAATRFVSLTGAYDQANRGAEVFAKTAAASGASLEDVGAAAASLKNNLGINDAAGFQKGLSIMLAQGKAGAVELREMAALLPTIAPSFAKFGKTGTAGLADLGAALQVARQGFGSGAEAATGMNAAMVALLRSSGKLKKKGVNVYEKDGKTLRDFLDIIRDISKSSKLASQEDLLDVLGDTGAVRTVSELKDKLDQIDSLVAAGLASNAVKDDFAAYLESNAGRIERAWQRLQNTLAREVTPERLTVLVEAFEAVGRAAGFIVDNIKAIAIAFAAWKLAVWTRRIHSLALSLGTAAAEGASLAKATSAVGSQTPRALDAVSLPMADVGRKGALLGSAGVSGVARFAAGLSALGNVAAVGALSYELGSLLEKATGFSDWLNDIETRKPTSSRFDPTGEASKLRIFASQANASADKAEGQLKHRRLTPEDRRDPRKVAAYKEWRAQQEQMVRANRAEAADLQRQADVIEVTHRLDQSGFDWSKAWAPSDMGSVLGAMPGLGIIPSVGRTVQKVEKEASREKVTPTAMKALFKAAREITGKGDFAPETQRMVQGLIEAQQVSLRRQERREEQQRTSEEATIKAMQDWQQLSQELRDTFGLSIQHPLADMVGREPEP